MMIGSTKKPRGRPRKEVIVPKGPRGRPKKLQVKLLFKIERSSVIKPPLASKRVSVKVALELIHDEDYYQEVMEAGMDPHVRVPISELETQLPPSSSQSQAIH